MSYLQDTGIELKKMLSALDEDEQKKIVRFVQNKIYDSYKNGKEAGGHPPKKPYGKYSKRSGKQKRGGENIPAFLFAQKRELRQRWQNE